MVETDKRKEYTNAVKWKAENIVYIMADIKNNHYHWTLIECLARLEQANKSIYDLKRALIFLKNCDKSN